LGERVSKQLQAATVAAPGFMGLNTQDSSVTLESGYALVANNCIIDKFGRIGSRKGWDNVHATNSDLGTAEVKTVYELRGPDNNVVLFAAGNNKLFIEQSGALVVKTVRNAADNADVSYTISDDHWQVSNIQQSGETKSYGTVVQAGHPVLLLNYLTSAFGFQRLGDLGTLPPGYTTSTFTPNCALAAYGRTWVADIAGDKQTVYFSDLIDATNYSTGTSGRLNIAEVVGDGDPITAITAHNGFLIIFCERHTVVYANAQDPTAITLSDVVTGIGCIARDSVQTTGTDVIFLSDTGVRSLARTIQEKSAPFRDLSKNVRDDLLVYVAGEEAKKIKSVYSPLDAFYLLSFPGQNILYCLDTRVQMQDGAARVTTWSELIPTAMCLTRNKEVYFGLASYVGKYMGYQDNGTDYEMSYYTNYFDYQTPTQLKILKKADFYLIGGASQTVSVKWDFDYEGSYESAVNTLDEGSISEYGIGEFNIAKYSGGVVITKLDVPASGTGRALQLGLESIINGTSLSVQKLDVYVKPGRVA
jgi:hypothetical protein